MVLLPSEDKEGWDESLQPCLGNNGAAAANSDGDNTSSHLLHEEPYTVTSLLLE